MLQMNPRKVKLFSDKSCSFIVFDYDISRQSIFKNKKLLTDKRATILVQYFSLLYIKSLSLN